MKLKTACIQMSSGRDMAANIEKTRAFVAEAAAKGCQLIATPENNFMMDEPGAKRVLYSASDHPGIKAASEMASKHKVWLLIGSVNVIPTEAEGSKDPSTALRFAQDDKKTFNRSILFSPDGKIVARYDKIHLFDVEVGDGQTYKESAKILAGDKSVIAETPWAKIGMTICYDVRFPHLYRALAKAGAEILMVPAAFTQVTGEAHWHTLLRARAIENSCFVIAPAQTGTHPGNRKTYGHSLFVDPWGTIIADGGTEEGVVVCEIDLGQVKKVRAKLPSLEHDREFEF